MKQVFIRAFVIIGSALLLFACSKANADLNQGTNNPSKSGKAITISATLTDALTKVSFTPEGSSTPKMVLAWEDGDQLRVANSKDHSSYSDFNLVSGATTKVGVFQGTPVSASSYDIWVLHQGSEFNSGATQTQDSEGDTRHIQYVAQANSVTDLNAVVFSDISSVLGLKAKLPSDVATTITSVELIASNNIFFSGNTLTINLNDASGAADDVLNLYATLPSGNKAIPNGTTLLVKFNSSNAAHSVYTRYVEFPDGKSFASGCLNHLQINASQSDTHAGLTSCNGTTADKAYLIADKYQLLAVADKLEPDATRYFKLVDDVDMDGVSWTSLNPSPFTNVVNFDGNGKKISNLGASLFNDLNGTIVNLTIEDAKVNGGSSITGILANTIKTAASTVTNVDILGTVTTPSYSSSITTNQYAGGLIGQIDAANTSITNCDVTNTNVSGTLAGGVVGFANALVTMSGCTYSGGTVSASARYCGGMLGSIADYASVISDCHVENATVTSSSDRVGGFVGQLQKKAKIKGCTVGTNAQRVTVACTYASSVVNAGGFAGVCYGSITKNGDVRSKAFVNITCSNTATGTNINIGGFVGYLEGGPVEYSDSDADMSSLVGQQVGGFTAWINKASTIDNCTSTGTIKGNNYTGGFIGNTAANSHTITNCSASGSVTGNATVGGFAGQIPSGTWTKNTTSCTVSGTTNIGGFAGQINGSANVSKCSSTGDTVSATGNVCGGFAAIAANGANISDSYSTSNLSGTSRKRGGLIGHVTEGTVSINRCYSTSTISANFELGGLIGFVADGLETFTLSKSAAWNAFVTSSSCASNNWSSAAIVGVSSLTCTLEDNYRNPGMALTAYWGTTGFGKELTASFQQPNVSSTTPLTDWDGANVTSSTMRPYNGKCETGKTLSELASTTLGWSSGVWNFTEDLPKLIF